MPPNRKIRELRPVTEHPADYEPLEEEILRILKRLIFDPVLAILKAPTSTLKNSASVDLLDAIKSGRIAYSRGHFKGLFSSTLTKALRSLGAEWDRKHGSYAVPRSKLPAHVLAVIDAAQAKYTALVKRIDATLAAVDIDGIRGGIKFSRHFSSVMWRTNERLDDTLSAITVTPKLSAETLKRVSTEYTHNMERYIKLWTKRAIVDLRTDMKKRVMSGFRYESAVDGIATQYEVSEAKAKFLARQETKLLVTTLKKDRYIRAGIEEYRWKTVVGAKGHEVRPMHKALDGKIFRWDSPPETNAAKDRNHPGEDYNCRCVAIPIVRF